MAFTAMVVMMMMIMMVVPVVVWNLLQAISRGRGIFGDLVEKQT